jgi:hypothetical protein
LIFRRNQPASCPLAGEREILRALATAKPPIRSAPSHHFKSFFNAIRQISLHRLLPAKPAKCRVPAQTVVPLKNPHPARLELSIHAVLRARFPDRNIPSTAGRLGVCTRGRNLQGTQAVAADAVRATCFSRRCGTAGTGRSSAADAAASARAASSLSGFASVQTEIAIVQNHLRRLAAASRSIQQARILFN